MDLFKETEVASEKVWPEIKFKSLSDPSYNFLIDIFYESIKDDKDVGTFLREKIAEYYHKILGKKVDYSLDEDKLREIGNNCFGTLNNYTSLCVQLLDKNIRNPLLDERNKEDLEFLFSNDLKWEVDRMRVINQNVFLDNVRRVLDHIFYSALLWQFLNELSDSLKNYRKFKNVLRESNLLEISYLENIIRRWTINEKDKKAEIYNKYFNNVFNGIYKLDVSNFSIDYLLTNIFYNTLNLPQEHDDEQE